MMKSSLGFWRIITIGLVVLIILILIPYLYGISINGIIRYFNDDSIQLTLQKTLFNAVVSSVVLVSFGLTCALILINVKAFSFMGKNLGVLILPITLGNISIAFIFKLIFGDTLMFSYFAQGDSFKKLVFLLLLNLYQYGLLFVYLFWMQLQNISVEKVNYAVANHFSFYQKLKDVYLPHSRNLWLLLTSIGFVFTFYEEFKISYLFKVSEGTNSELITSWLSRNYQTNLLVNPEYARKLIFDASAFAFLYATIGLIILLLLVLYFVSKATGSKIYYNNKMIKSSRYVYVFGLVMGSILTILSILPLFLSLYKINYSFNYSILGFPLLMTFCAAFLSSVIAILFGISSRLGWKDMLSSFDRNSLPFFVLLYLLLLVPPIVILLMGYKWMALIGYASIGVIYAIWIVGHVLFTLPVLGSFVLFNHFRVSSNEINYLQVYRLSKFETIRLSFLSRFRAEYLLLFIIGYSFVWNESVLNNLFSDYIPSFVSGMKMLITGRGADYNKAYGYIFVSFELAVTSVAIWRFIIEKAQKQLDAEV